MDELKSNTESFFEQAWNILVTLGGAMPDEKERFVRLHEHPNKCGISEYRFCGILGFGGKFWVNCGPGSCPVYVTCYPEDANQKRKRIIVNINSALNELYEKMQPIL